MNISAYLTRTLKCCMALLVFIAPLTYVYALNPVITIVTSGSTATATVQISGADPNMPANLYFTSGITNATQYQTIGVTDSNGNLSATIGQNTYNISKANPVFVMVNNTPSASVDWPLTYSVSASAITFGITSPIITQGQSLLVPLSGGTGFYSISEVANPSNALPTIVGQSLSVYGNAVGSTTVKVCNTPIVCATQTISVVASTSTAITPISVIIPVRVGETMLLPLTGGNGQYYLTTPITTPFKAIISGAFLSVTGVSSGANIATVCTSASVCQVFMFAVTGQAANPQSQPYVPSTQTSQSYQPITNPTKYIFSRGLAPGMRSNEVLELQKRLQLEGYLENTPNGYYGAGTTAAVKAFQRDNGLAPLGTVGPGTRAALNAE
jgi:hypothetical protein